MAWNGLKNCKKQLIGHFIGLCIKQIQDFENK